MSNPLLEAIASPDDLKELERNQLVQLSAEVRQRIIDVLAQKGGHLSSNLGAVELTVALHYVFDSPKDKFLWDTSHQTYAHKLLTGRGGLFDQIRQYQGLCGFSNPDESLHDHFFAGHAGTALSLALGMAKNRDLSGRNESVIAVVGDAAFTCGLTLEALNNISPDLKNFIIILNDNAMAISENVGAISDLFGRLMNNPKSDLTLTAALQKKFGHHLLRRGRSVCLSGQSLVSPAGFFAQFGLSYYGPFDGHDVKRLVSLFESVKEREVGPIVLHLLTNKGQGMDLATEDPTGYHGPKGFDLRTGQLKTGDPAQLTFPKIFGRQILKMAETDPSLVVITPAMSAGSCLDPMRDQFPDRCLDVGIAEGHAVTCAGGIAYGGKMKVVCSIYATFLQRAFDNLFHDICLQKLPVLFAIDRGGIAGGDGHTHNGIYDISFLYAMPNMVICQPRNGQLLVELLESAFSWGRPTAIRYPNLSTEAPSQPLQPRPLATGELIARGADLLIIALGHKCATALEVREKLRAEVKVEATVVDPVFLKPLDADLLHRLLLTHKMVVTIEEHSLEGGLGMIINNFLISQGYSQAQVLNIGIAPQFVAQGDHRSLTRELGLDADSIAEQIALHFSLREGALQPV